MKPHFPPSFLHLAGTKTGKRKALLIHGILSSAEKTKPVADALIKGGTCDSVWAYDSWAYWGDVTRAMKLKPADALDLLSLKGVLLGLGRVVAQRMAMVVETPSHTIEGAGQEIAGLLALLGWEDVTLVGHSLGGLVARCAVEAYGADKQVSAVVSLGTPHWLWSKAHSPEDWDEKPIADVRYLQIVGNDDWVVYRKGWGDLSADDNKFKGIVKVLYPGLDHTTVRSKADGSYIPSIITAVRETPSLWRKDDLFLTDYDSKTPTLNLRNINSDMPETKALGNFSGKWLQFQVPQISGS